MWPCMLTPETCIRHPQPAAGIAGIHGSHADRRLKACGVTHCLNLQGRTPASSGIPHSQSSMLAQLSSPMLEAGGINPCTWHAPLTLQAPSWASGAHVFRMK